VGERPTRDARRWLNRPLRDDERSSPTSTQAMRSRSPKAHARTRLDSASRPAAATRSTFPIVRGGCLFADYFPAASFGLVSTCASGCAAAMLRRFALADVIGRYSYAATRNRTTPPPLVSARRESGPSPRPGIRAHGEPTPRWLAASKPCPQPVGLRFRHGRAPRDQGCDQATRSEQRSCQLHSIRTTETARQERSDRTSARGHEPVCANVTRSPPAAGRRCDGHTIHENADERSVEHGRGTAVPPHPGAH
jgi:hypothetical protein